LPCPPRAPTGDAPLVLVAMSTTFQDQIGCLQRVIDALGALPVRGLVTTGPAIDPAALAANSNVAVVKSAPHRQVLQQAALVVTHAGHGTVMKALAAGVPLVMLPHGRDQDDTAARVTARQAGIVIERTATPDAIARAIRQVLQNDAYRKAARSLGNVIVCEAESSTLLNELEA
jgi:MGT family glycosyltransferase